MLQSISEELEQCFQEVPLCTSRLLGRTGVSIQDKTPFTFLLFFLQLCEVCCAIFSHFAREEFDLRPRSWQVCSWNLRSFNLAAEFLWFMFTIPLLHFHPSLGSRK